MKSATIRYTLFLLLTTCYIYTIDNLHFYRAPFFFSEPRFEKEVLTTVDINVAGGRTRQGINQCGRRTRLLDIYGFHNMQAVGINVPTTTPTVDTILSDLADLTPQGVHDRLFGVLSYSARFRDVEGYLSIYQNLIKRFFVQIHLPIRAIKIDQICMHDLTPDPSENPSLNKDTPEWQAFLENFCEILDAYGIQAPSMISHSGLADSSLLAGWTINYEDTTYIDFIDATIRAGVLFPTGKVKNENLLFDIPLGYNGHRGYPLRIDWAVGYFDWLTLGGHIQTLKFSDAIKTMRLKTDASQSGMIKLARGCVQVKKGTLWDLGLYIKADHVIGGLSALCGYTYGKKKRDWLEIQKKEGAYTTRYINDDPMLYGWRMHTLHFAFEYDFTQPDQVIGPRVSVLFNINTKRGRQIFTTNMYGVGWGIDCAWEY